MAITGRLKTKKFMELLLQQAASFWKCISGLAVEKFAFSRGPARLHVHLTFLRKITTSPTHHYPAGDEQSRRFAIYVIIEFSNCGSSANHFHSRSFSGFNLPMDGT